MTGDLGLPALPRGASVPLCFALVSQVADRLNLRVLLVKGPGLIAQGLRTARDSADVDVWVDPARHAELLQALRDLGWYWRPISTRGLRVAELHSVTLIHDEWPNDIDVHRFFPGFLLPHQQAFETLWQQRELVKVANQPVPVPGRADHALLEALHRLRGGEEKLSDSRVSHLLKQVTEDPDLLDQVWQRSVAVGARYSAAPFLRLLGFEVPEPSEPSQELLQWRAQGESLSVGNALLALRTAPWYRRPGIIWFAIFPTPSNLFASNPGVTGPAVLRYWRLWWRRLRGSVSQFARLPGFLRRYSRVKTSDAAWGDDTPDRSLLANTSTRLAGANATWQSSNRPGEESVGASSLATLDPSATASPLPDVSAGTWGPVPSLAQITLADDRVFVLDPLSHQPLELTGSGAQLWPRLQLGASVEDLVSWAKEQGFFPPDAATATLAEQQTQQFVATLAQQHILQLRTS